MDAASKINKFQAMLGIFQLPWTATTIWERCTLDRFIENNERDGCLSILIAWYFMFFISSGVLTSKTNILCLRLWQYPQASRQCSSKWQTWLRNIFYTVLSPTGCFTMNTAWTSFRLSYTIVSTSCKTFHWSWVRYMCNYLRTACFIRCFWWPDYKKWRTSYL